MAGYAALHLVHMDAAPGCKLAGGPAAPAWMFPEPRLVVWPAENRPRRRHTGRPVCRWHSGNQHGHRQAGGAAAAPHELRMSADLLHDFCMKLTAPPPPAVSDLPLARVPLKMSPLKQRRSDGAWYGFSKQMIRNSPVQGDLCETEVVVSHLEHDGLHSYSSFPKPTGWDAVCRHQIAVRVWRVGELIGMAYFMRYAVADNYDMAYPTVWASGCTDVVKEWRRRGAAKTIYAHLKGYGYTIAPAPILLGDGEDLWTCGLDPHIKREAEAGRRVMVRDPQIAPPPTRHDDQLPGLLTRFRVTKSLQERLWRPQERRVFVSSLEGEVYDFLRGELAATFHDPNGALAELLADCRADIAVAEMLAKQPGQYGSLRKPRPRGILGWLRRRPAGPNNILEPLKMARDNYAGLLSADDHVHRCTYVEDCKDWVGRKIRVLSNE